MLRLVFAYGYKVCVIEQYVGGHQDRVVEKTGVDVGETFGFVFESVCELEPLVWEKTGEVPGQFGCLRYVALAVENCLRRVQPHRKPCFGYGIRVFTQFLCVLYQCERMQVGYKKERLVFALGCGFYSRKDSPQDVAQVRAAGGLYASKYSCHCCTCVFSFAKIRKITEK